MSAADLRPVVASLSTIVHASDEADAVVRIDLLFVPEEIRGRGCARDALTQIAQWADETGTALVLTATYGLGANITRLVALYMQHGFTVVEITDLNEVRMRRDPLALVPAIPLTTPYEGAASCEPGSENAPRTCSA